MKTLISLLILFPFLFTQTNTDLHFLEGTWKAENKESYESWKRTGDGQLKGNSYKIKAGKKIITEELQIRHLNSKVVYQARVLNQNNAQVIEFELNKNLKNKYSFENSGHDFPKKIQYTKLNDTTIFVEVLGENDKGYAYKMGKLK